MRQHLRRASLQLRTITEDHTQCTSARLAVDIGGTFTDLALEHAGGRTTVKVLTTPAAPEQGVLNGVRAVLETAGLAPGDIGILIHGTTLATNAVIERKGAVTALITTEGFRDVLAMGNESRYDQYDLNIVLPEPLVPRHLRLPVPERLDNEGNILRPLDEARRARTGAAAEAGGRGEHRRRPAARLRQPGRTSSACAPSSPKRCRTSRCRCPARSRPRCASGSVSPPPSPTPTCSR